MLLKWDKPQQVMSQQDWLSLSASDAPPGVYTPNMSEQDKQAWKAKLVGKRGGIKQVEIRKTLHNGAQLVLTVSTHGGFRPRYPEFHPNGIEYQGKNIKITTNSPAVFDWLEWEAVQIAIREAREVLEQTK